MRKPCAALIVSILFLGTVHAQKRAVSIAAGPLISFPLRNYGFPSNLRLGGGLEAIGQYNFTNKSSVLLQTSLASWGVKVEGLSYNSSNKLTMLSLKSGYRYQFGDFGYFIDGLVGTDIETADGFSTISFTLGGGKRFFVYDDYFIDAGIDYIDGDTERRINVKAVFSLFRRPKHE